MSPTPANDFAPEVSLADLLTQADDLQRQIDAVLPDNTEAGSNG